MRIAIMQPYFIPYAGYFRLFCATDLFVIYDCVQFVRRGWVHRNRLNNAKDQLEWLTLPIRKAPQDILLQNIEFQHNAQSIWDSRLQVFPKLFHINNELEFVLPKMMKIEFSPVDYIVTLLRSISQLLKFPFQIVKSSTLNVPPTLRGEERIIQITRQLGGKTYINLSGGRSLYDSNNFAKHGIKLLFLNEYIGSYESIIQRLLNTSPKELHSEISKQSKLD